MIKENTWNIIISEINKSGKITTEKLIDSLNKKEIHIDNERDLRLLISALNQELLRFGMRIKWISNGDAEWWILVVEGNKPSFITPQMERCLVSSVFLQSLNDQKSFTLEEIVQALNDEKKENIIKSVESLIKESYLTYNNENKLIIGQRTLSEIDVPYLLQSIKNFPDQT